MGFSLFLREDIVDHDYYGTRNYDIMIEADKGGQKEGDIGND